MTAQANLQYDLPQNVFSGAMYSKKIKAQKLVTKGKLTSTVSICEIHEV